MSVVHADVISHPANSTGTRDRDQPFSRLLGYATLTIGTAVPITGNGRILLLHLVALVLLPVIIGTFRRMGQTRWLMATLLVWAVAQIGSDLYHHQLSASSRFAGTPLTVVLTVLVLKWCVESLGLDQYEALLALSIGWLINLVVFLHALHVTNPWKYELAEPVTLIALCALLKFGSRRSAVASAIVLLTAVSIATSFRSMAAILAVSLAAYLVAPAHAARPSRPHSRRLTGVSIVALIASVYLLYPPLARDGLFGPRDQLQAETLEATHANLLVYNRPEAFQAAYLFARHPIIGIGSHGSVSSSQATDALSFLSRNGAALNVNTTPYLLDTAEGSPGFASHSMALDAALRAGFLALAFWIMLLGMIARQLLRRGISRARDTPIVFYVLLTTAWNAMFSPLTATTYLPITVAIMVLAGATERSPGGRLGQSR